MDRLRGCTINDPISVAFGTAGMAQELVILRRCFGIQDADWSIRRRMNLVVNEVTETRLVHSVSIDVHGEHHEIFFCQTDSVLADIPCSAEAADLPILNASAEVQIPVRASHYALNRMCVILADLAEKEQICEFVRRAFRENILDIVSGFPEVLRTVNSPYDVNSTAVITLSGVKCSAVRAILLYFDWELQDDFTDETMRFLLLVDRAFKAAFNDVPTSDLR